MTQKIQICVTGLTWMGSGIGSVESIIDRMFKEAQNEILISVYAISNASDVVLDRLETALTRGILIRIVINRLMDQPEDVINKLFHFAASYQHLYIYDFTDPEGYDLHAKVIVCDQRLALIGSSNLSRRGLLNNHELGIFIEGEFSAQVVNAINKLIDSKNVSLCGRAS